MAEKQLDNERQIIETYMQEHGLETTLNDVVNQIVKTRPLDPYVKLGQSLLRSSETANAITGVDAREILSGAGSPALEVEISTQQGEFRASTTIGPYDDDDDRFGGRGLKKAADSVRAILAEKLLSVDVTNQEAIDATLSGEDAAPANAVLACSMACCRAAAKHGGLPLHEHLSALAAVGPGMLPMPSVAVVNGGGYGTGGPFPFEEVSVVPVGARSFEDAVDVVAAIHRAIPAACEAAGLPKPGLGSRGGYAVSGDAPGDVIKVVHEAMKLSGMDEQAKIAVDTCAPAFAKQHEEEEETTVYDFSHFCAGEPRAPPKSADEMVETYMELLMAYPIMTVEDPFLGKDVFAFLKLKERLDLEAARAAEPADVDSGDQDAILRLEPLGGDDACTLQLAGDLVCENTDDIEKFDEQKTVNTLTLTLKKGKTVTGAIELAKAARARGWGIVVAAETESGETDEAFSAHFATGLRCGQFKAGGFAGGEHLAKYNELLRIAASPNPPPWCGSDFRATASM